MTGGRRFSRILAGLLAGGLPILCLPAATAVAEPGYTLYGTTGLIDMPSAEMQPDGQINWTHSQFANTQRTSLGFQLLPWVEGAVHYSTIDDFRSDGDDQSDRSFDLKFRLFEEQGALPSVAIGLRDFLGTSPYGAEYLVATKTVTDALKVTGGIGWGRLGSAGSFGAPFGDRPDLTDPTGQVQTQTFFRGDAAVFGGVEWETGIRNLTLKAEYSSDAYEPEGEFSGFEVDSPFNFALEWKPNRTVTAGLYYLYGDTVGFSLTLTGNPNRPLTPQDLGAGPVPVRARPADAPRGGGWAGNANARGKLIAAMSEALATDGISIEQARLRGAVAEVYISNGRIQREPKAIGRTARVMALALPPSVETFRITLVESNMPVTTAVIKRSDLEAQVDRPDAGYRSFQTTRLIDAAPDLEGDGVWRRDEGRRFSWSFNPRIPFSLFDPDEPLRLDAQLVLSGNYRVAPGFKVSAGLSKWIVGTPERTELNQPPQELPRVRSRGALYNSGNNVELDKLYAEYVFKLTDDVYGRVSAGLLERMYGGVSGEVLWKPTNSAIGLGAELNYAKARDPFNYFALSGYDTVTGHASVYWDTGYYGLEAQVDAGRYLAGDWGATFTLTRRFQNGWEIAGYFTRTDVSFEEFGDDSFSKGVKLTMPLRWTLPFESKSSAGIDLGSVGSDGGARLRVDGRLYDRIKTADALSLEDNWGSFWQ
jgi:hypothetical protein